MAGFLYPAGVLRIGCWMESGHVILEKKNMELITVILRRSKMEELKKIMEKFAE